MLRWIAKKVLKENFRHFILIVLCFFLQHKKKSRMNFLSLRLFYFLKSGSSRINFDLTSETFFCEFLIITNEATTWEAKILWTCMKTNQDWVAKSHQSRMILKSINIGWQSKREFLWYYWNLSSTVMKLSHDSRFLFSE
jgi:hypothetical protein